MFLEVRQLYVIIIIAMFVTSCRLQCQYWTVEGLRWDRHQPLASENFLVCGFVLITWHSSLLFAITVHFSLFLSELFILLTLNSCGTWVTVMVVMQCNAECQDDADWVKQCVLMDIEGTRQRGGHLKKTGGIVSEGICRSLGPDRWGCLGYRSLETENQGEGCLTWVVV